MGKVIRRRGYVSERERFSQYVAQINAASAGWSGQAAQSADLPEGLLRREYAWRKAELISDFVVPSAIATGYAVIGAGAGVFMARIGGVDAVNCAMAGAGISGAVAFIVLTRNMLRSMWTVEEFGTEEVEEVETERRGVESPRPCVQVELQEGQSLRYMDLPVSDEKVFSVATHCLLNNKKFSRRAMGHILTQSEYDDLRAAMLEAGLLREVGRANELTGAGRAVLSKWL